MKIETTKDVKMLVRMLDVCDAQIARLKEKGKCHQREVEVKELELEKAKIEKRLFDLGHIGENNGSGNS